MANKRRSNNPLPNWREKIAPDDQERWIPEEASPEKKRMVPEPSRSHEIGDELNRGVTSDWMRMAACRAKAKAKWGTSPCNRRAVEAEALRLYRNSGW